MKHTVVWIAPLVLAAIPFLLLLAAGLYWLWSQQLILLWGAITAVSGFTGWLVNRALKRKRVPPETLKVDPSTLWSGKGIEAWGKVEAIAERAHDREPDLESTDFYTETLREVMETVALHFHPQRKNALLELRVPDALRVIELLSRDFRTTFSENVPGSHLLTVNDIARGHRLAARGGALLKLYRIVAAGIDPISAAVRELGFLATDNVLSDSTKAVKKWLVDAYVKKIGYYAIELYSGRLVLDDAIARTTTRASRVDVERAEAREDLLQEEPLRILAIGQVNAGKSSLVNALSAEMKAVVDVVPRTEAIHPYVLDKDGVPRAVIMDAAGYQETEQPLRVLKPLLDAIVRTDLILLVRSAMNLAGGADKAVLDQLSVHFREATDEAPPAVIVALSHIDRLRPFREWSPPYDVVAADSAKARSIRQAMEITAEQLGIDIDQVVPVNLKNGQLYNVEEGLLPAILQNLESATRLKYLRCLEEHKSRSQLQALWRQSKNAGRFISREGLRWIGSRS